MIVDRPLERALGLSKKDNTARIRLLAVCLLLLDVLLLGTDAFHHFMHYTGQQGALADFMRLELWRGQLDGSVIELTGHVKMMVAATVLLVVGWRIRRWVLPVWGTVLLVMVADDFFMVHERSGYLLEGLTGAWNVIGLRAQDVGQLLFWAITAAALGTLLLLAHIKADVAAQTDSRLIFACVAALALFAVGVDMMLAVIDSPLGGLAVGVIVDRVLNYIEMAGEHITMSLIMLASVLILERRSRVSAA